jgi:NADH-quinone oxidoreductase subunit A
MGNLSGNIGIFLIAGIILISVPLILNWLIAPRSKNEDLSNYECGEDPIGKNRLQFKIQYFLTAIVFIVFEVEAIYIIPWAVMLEKLGVQALIAMGIFLGILTLGLIYAIVKKAFDWN